MSGQQAAVGTPPAALPAGVGYDAAMLSQINLTALAVVRAAEEHGEPAVNPWFIGGGVLAFLLFLLLGLVWFGGGRDHS